MFLYRMEKGICGQVAVSLQTFVSQDVNAEDNYIACSTEVQSEIVVPILKNEVFVAQLDVDSNTKFDYQRTNRTAGSNLP